MSTEPNFSLREIKNLTALIRSVTNLIDNTEYRGIIDNYIPLETLKKLAIELMQQYAKESELTLKERYLNDIIDNIKKELKTRTSSTPVEDIDFYKILMRRKKADTFKTVVNAIKKEKEILRKDIQGFQVVANRKCFNGAGDLKNVSGKRSGSFSKAFNCYDDPYLFLKNLREIDEIPEVDYYKYFVKVEYKILNAHGYDVSGGERSEFRLLQEINDAQQFDILLIDEPESFFDNIFLLNKVNKLIKDISKNMPVVIVTHNSTVGASIQPDYVVYTRKKIENSDVEYEVYAGYPTDKNLTGLDKKYIKSREALLDCLEAGETPYNERGTCYEILKS